MVDNTGFFRLRIRLHAILLGAGVVACAATVLGFLGPFWWLFDLFSHFRIQYLLGLGALAVIFLFHRLWRTAAAFLAFAAVNLIPVLPLYFGGTAPPAPNSKIWRAMLINVNAHSGDPARVRQAVEQADPDILVLEEISARWASDLSWLCATHPYCVIEPREDNFGIALFSKLPLVRSRTAIIGSAEVPSILATAKVDGRELGIMATHPLPPAGAEYSRWRNEQLDLMPKHVDASGPFLLLGDLNTTPWNHYFRRLLDKAGLLDSSRGCGIQPTWPSFAPLLRIPIDHVLHSPSVSVLQKAVGPDVGSDHFPVVMDFRITGTPAEGAR